ncbi:hypothetical protein CRUP_018702, partial [Coryphaenoides rupestris]
METRQPGELAAARVARHRLVGPSTCPSVRLFDRLWCPASGASRSSSRPGRREESGRCAGNQTFSALEPAVPAVPAVRPRNLLLLLDGSVRPPPHLRGAKRLIIRRGSPSNIAPPPAPG